MKQTNRTLVFVGGKKSGKSSLITKYLDQNLKEEMPETTALEYIFGTKTREAKQVKVNIYELGGGISFNNLLESAFTGSSIAAMTVVIVIDLSKPGNAIENLIFWLTCVREQS